VTNNTDHAFQVIVGKQLGAITFVQDYWQFAFDGPVFTALTRVEVQANGIRVRDGDDQFRNILCGQIGRIVKQVSFVQPEAITITFEDQSSISISLKRNDYRGPEAAHFLGRDGRLMVIRADS
jgi:hypothetical protein